MTDELLIKFLLKETSEEESIAVQKWLDAAPANREQFVQFKKIWNAAKNLTAKSKADEEQAWMRFKERTVSLTDKKPVGRKLKPGFGWLRIAAVLALITGIWVGYSVFGPADYTDLTAGNEVVVEQLPDGSEVTLNKNSHISYATDFKDDRSVKLDKGNVFFNVAHDKNRPFVIKVNKVSVTVVGTSFNVKHLNGQTEIIVETGIVKVGNGRDVIELHKGEKVLIEDLSPKMVKEQNTDQLYTYYRSKRFTLTNTPLFKIVKVLNEAYGAQIIILDQSIKNATITTTLEVHNTLDYNLKIIKETLPFNLKTDRNGEQILLSKSE